MRAINGQPGAVADFDEIEGIFEGNDDDEDINEVDETQRSVKLMLRSKKSGVCERFCCKFLIASGGVIPDSTMIHAARKRRQMAREMGTPGDYISLNTAENGSSNQKSRIIRYGIVLVGIMCIIFFLVMMIKMQVMIVQQRILI